MDLKLAFEKNSLSCTVFDKGAKAAGRGFVNVRTTDQRWLDRQISAEQ